MKKNHSVHSLHLDFTAVRQLQPDHVNNIVMVTLSRAYLLKETSNEMAPILTFIFQASLLQSSVPSDWKKANIVPLFKKGDRTVPNNYRPVSLTCICSKILEHIVYSHIFTHLTQYTIHLRI